MGYEFWQDAIAGKSPAMHEGDPQPGFYRKRVSRGGTYVPVAIWEQDGKMIALVDGKEADAGEIWSYVCDKAVTEEEYRARVDTGRWSDEDEGVAQSLSPPRVGDNNPPQDEAETLEGQIHAASSNAEVYAEISDDETASRAQSARSRLLELSGKADKRREALKRPHLEAGKTIDARWQPLVKRAKEAADLIRKAIGAHETRKFQEAEKLRLAAEEKVRAAEIERKRLLAEQLAAHPEAPPPPERVATFTPASIAAQPIRGAYGRAATVKAVKIATVEDYAEATTYFRNDADYRAVIDKLAQRAVDAGFAVPGVKVTEERKVS